MVQEGLEALSEREQRIVKHYGERRPISHDTNQEFDTTMTFGQRLADKVASFGGSWTFIIIFGAILLAWVALNAVILARRGDTFDPYPIHFAQSFSLHACIHTGTDYPDVAESAIGKGQARCRP